MKNLTFVSCGTVEPFFRVGRQPDTIWNSLNPVFNMIIDVRPSETRSESFRVRYIDCAARVLLYPSADSELVSNESPCYV